MAAKWNDEDTEVLIKVWAADSIQKKLSASMRNIDVFEQISRILNEKHGLNRTAVQCRTKIKKLRSAFNRAEDPCKVPFHELLAPVLQNQPIPLYALNLQFVNAMQSASQRNHRGPPPVITEDPYDEDTFPTPDDCDDDDDELASPDSAHESLHDIEIIHNDIDDEDDDDSSADMPPHNDPHNHDTSSSQGNNILHEDPGLPQFTVSSPKDATARVTASEKLTRKRKSSADMTRAALESALNTFREISREEMRAFNEAENERWEKWMQLERERQAHERKQDKMMFSFLQKAFGCSGGERENCSVTTNEGASNDENASV